MHKLEFGARGVFAGRITRAALSVCIGVIAAACTFAQSPPPAVAPAKTPPILGTIKAIAGESLTVATDAGAEAKVNVTPATKLLRVPPGSKDLSQAEAIP